jgi:anti-sigma factor RsiW
MTTRPPTPIDDDTLQRFYDGDLSPLEEHGVQARIEADPAAQQRLAELGRLTELIREGAEELGESVRSSTLFAAIEARLAEPDQVGLGARLRVIGGEWLEHRRASLLPLVAATAVAAVTLMVVIRPSSQLPETSGAATPRAQEQAAQQAAPVAPTQVAEVHGSSVENVDFGASTGTVFEIDNEGVAVAVVWITDDDEETP